MLLIGAGLVFVRQWVMQLPSVQQQIQAANGAVVRVTFPQNHTDWPLDVVIPVHLNFQTEEPLKTLELYADGSLVHQQDVLSGRIPAVLYWQPSKTGATILTSRLITEAGQAYVSEPAIIQLRVSRPPSSGKIPQLSISQEMQDRYRIGVYSEGVNDSRLGNWFPVCGFHEGVTGENAIGYNDVGVAYRQKTQLNLPLHVALYLPKGLSLPRRRDGFV